MMNNIIVLIIYDNLAHSFHNVSANIKLVFELQSLRQPKLNGHLSATLYFLLSSLLNLMLVKLALILEFQPIVCYVFF